MRSYGLYVAGADAVGAGWTYCVRASWFLRDPAASFGVKRALELGELAPADAPDGVFARCAVSGEEDNAKALEAARRASAEWGRTPLALRRQLMLDFHDAVADRRDELVDLLVAEGHPRRLADWEVSGVLEGGSRRTVDWLMEQFHQEFDVEGGRVVLTRRPDGVVCVNPPANASGSNGAMGVAALAAGNAVVIKAPRTTPASVMFLYREIVAPLLERAGAPPGTLSIISGETKRILRQWMNSPFVDDVMFFGDSTVGLKVGAECVAKGKKPVLELSGNDGCVVWRDADLDAAARALSECFYGSSQICMVPKFAIVHPAVADELLERLEVGIAGIRPGFPEDPEVLLSPVLKADRFFDVLGEAQRAGAELLSGGRQVDVRGAPDGYGLFLEPTLLRVDGFERADGLSCVREETFFPLLPVVVPEPAPDDELLEATAAFLNANPYGLRNSFWSSSPEVIDHFATRVTNGGQLRMNASHIGFAPVLGTHGGTGRTGGPFGELNYPMLRTSRLQGISLPASARAEAGVGA